MERVETERFKRFTYDEIVARDKLNLDITWLRDDSETDAASLPDPDTLIAEIVEELTAAARELAAAASPDRDHAPRVVNGEARSPSTKARRPRG